MDDWYAVLGVPRGAPDAAVKAAFRRLALRHHPDRNPGDARAQERFVRVNRAYEVLSDPDARRAHDQELALLEGRSWRPPEAAGKPAPEPPPRWTPAPPPPPPGKGLTPRQAAGRGLIAIGALLALRGLLGVYLAPRAGALEPWLALDGGPDQAFLLYLCGMVVSFVGAGVLMSPAEPLRPE